MTMSLRPPLPRARVSSSGAVIGADQVAAWRRFLLFFLREREQREGVCCGSGPRRWSWDRGAKTGARPGAGTMPIGAIPAAWSLVVAALLLEPDRTLQLLDHVLHRLFRIPHGSHIL